MIVVLVPHWISGTKGRFLMTSNQHLDAYSHGEVR
jgi:hypothetical protein